jgi:hypothetical protein
MRKEMRWRDLLGYFRTWSSLHKYLEIFPQDKLAPHDGRFIEDLEPKSKSDSEFIADTDNKNGEEDIDVAGGDIAVRFWKDLRQGAIDEKGKSANVAVDDAVVVEWPLAVILVSKI